MLKGMPKNRLTAPAVMTESVTGERLRSRRVSRRARWSSVACIALLTGTVLTATVGRADEFTDATGQFVNGAGQTDGGDQWSGTDPDQDGGPADAGELLDVGDVAPGHRSWPRDPGQRQHQIQQAIGGYSQLPCLVVEGAKKSAGTKAATRNCTGNPDQVWWLDQDGHIRNYATDKCLEVRTDKKKFKPGAAVYQEFCSTAPGQKWIIPTEPSPRNATMSVGTIGSAFISEGVLPQCLDIPDAKVNRPVQIWDCNGLEPFQQWAVTLVPEGIFPVG